MAQIGRYFEEFNEGEIIEHKLSKTIFESDNNLFSLLTMNHHPVHLNRDYAQTNQHERILVVGTLVFSLSVGMTVPEISGKAIANLDYENVVHKAPVFIGDTLYASTEILGVRESKNKPDRGIIYVKTKVKNQDDTTVLTFKRHVLVKKGGINMMDDFLMRSLMFVPAHNKKLIEKSVKTNADVLVPDLEDSVQPNSNKAKARENTIKYVQKDAFSGCHVFPRINDRESGELLKDVMELTLSGIDGFMYPKSKTSRDIVFFDKLLETVEYEKGIEIGTFKIIALIETASAVLHAEEIATASSRIIAIAFGNEDYLGDVHGQNDKKGSPFFTARSMIAMAARSAGVAPVDTVHTKVHDLDDLKSNLKIATNLGFEGMLVLHPKELPLIHQYYSPAGKEVKAAKEMVQAFKRTQDKGEGVAIVNGKFVGPPLVRQAENILKKNKLIEKKTGK